MSDGNSNSPTKNQALKDIQNNGFNGADSASIKNVVQTLLPKGGDIKEALKYLDIGIKLEMLLYDLSSYLFWGSLAELGAFMFSLMLFFTDAAEMAAIFFFIIHIPRGILGLLLIKKMPVSHQMLNKVLVNEPNKTIPFEKIKEICITVGYETLNELSTGCGKLLMFYFITTLVCFLLDIIAFFVQVA